MMGRTARAGVVTLLLLVGAVAACGGDGGSGDGDGTGLGPSGGDKGDANGEAGGGDGGSGDGDGGDSAEGDPCSLLEVSEIETEFGDRGAVADGERLGFSCAWQVGDISDPSSGIVVITRARGAGSPEQSMAEIRDLESNPVDVEGVGDEACLCSGGLWFRSGAITFSVTASFGDDVPDVEEKLTTLAQHMLDRA